MFRGDEADWRASNGLEGYAFRNGGNPRSKRNACGAKSEDGIASKLHLGATGVRPAHARCGGGTSGNLAGCDPRRQLAL